MSRNIKFNYDKIYPNLDKTEYLLDTSIMIDIIKQHNYYRDNNSYNCVFSVTSFTLYELLKNKSEADVKKTLKILQVYLKGIYASPSTQKIIENYFKPEKVTLENDFEDFNIFLKELTASTMTDLTQILAYYFSFSLRIDLLVKSILITKYNDLKLYTHSMKIYSDDKILGLTKDFIYNQILTSTDFKININDLLYGIKLIFLSIMNNLGHEIDESILNLITVSDIKKAHAIIKNDNTDLSLEVKNLTTDKFMEYLINKIVDDNVAIKGSDNYKSIIKFLLKKSKIMDRKIESNDFIDFMNISIFLNNNNNNKIEFGIYDKEWNNILNSLGVICNDFFYIIQN